MEWKDVIIGILLFIFIIGIWASVGIHNINNLNDKFEELETKEDVYDYLKTCREESFFVDCDTVLIKRLEK